MDDIDLFLNLINSVPLLMSSVQTLIQIFLELALVSPVRVGGFKPTIHTVATIKLVCEWVQFLLRYSVYHDLIP